MNIDLSSIDRSNFLVHEHKIGGETVYLVQPNHIGTKWSKDTLHFRSSVWDSEGNLVSASFPKFFNMGEHPEITPPPSSLNDTKLLEKIDGSTLILSRWKGHTIARTRGTVDARLQDNGWEIDYILAKYPSLKQFLESYETMGLSLLFEWTTPSNIIVISPGKEPDITLIGAIMHENYHLFHQTMLDSMAKHFGVKRPRTYSFDSIEDMRAAVKEFKGVEGVCMYYNNEQNILKIKGDWYLSLHRFKSEISSIEKVLDVWLEQGRPDFNTFHSFISTTFDYEIAEQARPHMQKICETWVYAEWTINTIRFNTPPLLRLSRREAAQQINETYGPQGLSWLAFSILDNKTIDDKSIKKLMLLCLERA